MRRFVFLAVTILLLFLTATAKTPPSAPSKTVPPPTVSAADLIKAEAEKTKAEAERTKAEAERTKADVERAKVEVDRLKLADARKQFYFDWSYRVGLVVAGLILLVWLVPQISEINLPWGSGNFSLKRAPKQLLQTEGRPPSIPGPAMMEATEILKKTLPPSTSQNLLGRLEETEVYQAAGVAKDTVYMCHSARKIRGSELYRIRMYLDAEEATILDKVEKVKYRLHPTFSPSEVTRTDRARQFEHEVTAWGEFMLYANVHFKDVAGSIELKRYLNF